MSELILHSMRDLKINYGQASTDLNRGEEDFDQVGQELVKVTCSTFAACREDEKRSRRSAWLHPAASQTPRLKTTTFLHCSLMHFSMNPHHFWQLDGSLISKNFLPFCHISCLWYIACKTSKASAKNLVKWLKGFVSVIMHCCATNCDKFNKLQGRRSLWRTQNSWFSSLVCCNTTMESAARLLIITLLVFYYLKDSYGGLITDENVPKFSVGSALRYLSKAVFTKALLRGKFEIGINYLSNLMAHVVSESLVKRKALESRRDL